MAEARRENSTPGFSNAQGDSTENSPTTSPRHNGQWPKRPEEDNGALLTLAEIQERYGISEYWVYQWAAEKRLHHVTIGKRRKYPNWEIEALLTISYHLSAAA